MGSRSVPRDPNPNTRDRRFKDKSRSILNSLLHLNKITRTGANSFDLALTLADIPDGITRDTELAAAIAAIVHNDLTGLQGGTTDEYYHLTAAEYAALGSGALADGDYGDIVVSSSGTVISFDSAVITTFARTFLDDTSASAVRTTIGAGTSSFDGAYSSLSGVPSTFAPSAHATSHKSAGSDPLLLNEFGNPSGSVQFSQQQALQFRIENRTSDPGSPATGEIWLRTDL